MTFGNYYNMNMMNNGWGGLIQQGLGMFGGGSYNMMGMGGSIFMNCFGEPNYSAMAGFGVASALLNVVGQATTSILAEKQAEKESAVDYKDRIDEIDEEIEELRNTDPEKAIDAHFDKDIETAKTNLDTANKALKDANKSKAELEAQLASATTDEEKAKIQKQIDALDIDKKQAEFDKLSGGEEVKGSVKYYEKQKADAIAKKEEEIKEEIEELKAERAKLQAKIDDAKLDDADGSKFQRTSAKKFNAKWSDDGSANKDAKFDKGDMRYAIAGFRNATNEADKKAWANKIATIYTYFEQNEQNSITPDFKCARQLVKSYVD